MERRGLVVSVMEGGLVVLRRRSPPRLLFLRCADRRVVGLTAPCWRGVGRSCHGRWDGFPKTTLRIITMLLLRRMLMRVRRRCSSVLEVEWRVGGGHGWWDGFPKRTVLCGMRIKMRSLLLMRRMLIRSHRWWTCLVGRLTSLLLLCLCTSFPGTVQPVQLRNLFWGSTAAPAAWLLGIHVFLGPIVERHGAEGGKNAVRRYAGRWHAWRSKDERILRMLVYLSNR